MGIILLVKLLTHFSDNTKRLSGSSTCATSSPYYEVSRLEILFAWELKVFKPWRWKKKKKKFYAIFRSTKQVQIR